MHSKPRLALAILTSPSAAFEEIIERRLLGTALIIVALTGLLAIAASIALGIATGPLQFLALGKENPLTWLGLCMLYTLGMWMLLKWLGTRSEYTSLLTVVGWSHIPLLLLQIVLVISAVMATSSTPNNTLIQFLDTTRFGLLIWYVAIVAIGIHVLTRIPLARAVMAYLVVAFAAVIAFSLTYGRARFAPFEALQQTIPETINLASKAIAADMTPWLAAAVIGLIAGIWHIGKSLGWDKGTIYKYAGAAGILGVLTLGFYVSTISTTGYYDRLVRVQKLYDADRFADAAKELESLLPATKENAGIMLDIADIYYKAGKTDESIKYYNKVMDYIEDAKLGREGFRGRARVYNGIGSAYDLDGKYDIAIQQFEKATKEWPEFREPWVRMAVTYDRMGEYDKAIKNANHAIKQLDSEAIVAWVALAEAFVQTGDTKQAKAAIAIVTGRDSELAKKIGTEAQDWKTAVDKLTAQNLSFPLEKEPAKPEAEKKEKAAKAGKTDKKAEKKAK